MSAQDTSENKEQELIMTDTQVSPSLSRFVANHGSQLLISDSHDDASGADMWWADKPVHYDGFIPRTEVEEKLLDWDANRVDMYADIPVDNVDNATGMDGDGNFIHRVSVPGKSAIVRSDTNAVIGVVGSDYKVHDYRDLMDDVVEKITGETLGIVSAGILDNGGKFWLQAAHEMDVRDDLSGIDYRSFIMVSSSVDGSMATQFNIATTIAICKNTFTIACKQNGNRAYRRKHSKHSNINISDARAALQLVDNEDEQFADFLREHVQMEVTDAQLNTFLDIWAPLPEEGKGRARAETKRDKFFDLYRNSDMCSPWKGTAFGVLQTANTFAHYSGEIRGSDRATRIVEATIKGKMADNDAATYRALEVAMA